MEEKKKETAQSEQLKKTYSQMSKKFRELSKIDGNLIQLSCVNGTFLVADSATGMARFFA